MRFAARFACLVVLPLASLAHAAPSAPAAALTLRWTDESPDPMIDRAVERATKCVDCTAERADREALAGISTMVALANRAAWGHARQGIDAVAAATTVSPEVRAEAALASRALAEDEGTEAGIDADRKLGVVTDVSVLGPFRDTGGGLVAKDGPEAAGASFADMRARYSWGTTDVAWRAVPRAFAGANGVPLDLFVHPRKESCTWVATQLTLPSAQGVVVKLATTGQARLVFDGTELGRSEDANASAPFARIAAHVSAGAGAHLIAAKVCAGAIDDQGLVRLVVTDEKGNGLAGATSADLKSVPVAASADKRGARGKASRTGKTGKTSAADDASAKVVAQPIVTPLARLLTLPPNATLDAQMDAAIVRTLGGADDLRSPRAPGLLDAIARRADTSADALAMAGWIAPSGANRSGWLNQARERANAAHDAKTSAFAGRRLIAEHLGAQMPDWAIASYRELAPSGDAEATLLGAMVNEALGTDALRTQAMRDLATAFHAAKARVPTNLVSELAAVSAGYDTALSREAREELARRGDRGGAWVQAESSRDAKAAIDAARVAFDTAGIDDADEAIGIARAVSRTGAHEAARKLFAKLVEWAPNRAEAWSGLADEIGATPDAQSDTASGAALRRARELAPAEARYREQLALRSRTANDGEEHDDEHYLVSSQTILARRKGVPAGLPDVSARDLHFVRAVVMHADHRVSMLIHYAREIVIAPRTEGELYEDLPADEDLTEILRARVHRKDGGTAFPAEEHNEGGRPRVRWPTLQPGDVVEVAVREWTRGPVGGRGDVPFYFMDPGASYASHPTLYNEVDVESLPDRPLYLDVLNGGDYKRTEKDENGRHVTRFIWEHPPVVADEPLAPNQTEIGPLTVGSTFKTWADFRTWYAEAVKGFTDPDDEVRRLAAELTKGKTTREAKLAAIFDFVSDDIRYVNYTSGEWWLPNRPQQLLARREGDCDDKAMLLITLLKAVGIEAQEVMVQTRMTAQPTPVLAKNAVVPMFDHGIAFLPGPGPNGGTYLDATSPQSRLGPLPSMDAKAVALRMDSGPAEIIHLPASNPEDHGSNVKWTITLKSDGSGDLVGEERHVGDGAFWLRTALSQADARLNYVESSLLGDWFPTVAVDKNIDFKGDLPHGEAWVKYKAKSDGIARHEGSELVVPISRTMTLASAIAPLVTRTLPVQLPPYFAPSHETRTIRIVAPAGWAWGELPAGGDENGGDFGHAHLEIARDARDPRTVVVTRSVSFDLDRIPVARYAAWRAWVQRTDALMHKVVRLVKEQGK
jgi:transglutaminase-like putative cysteine protease